MAGTSTPARRRTARNARVGPADRSRRRTTRRASSSSGPTRDPRTRASATGSIPASEHHGCRSWRVSSSTGGPGGYPGAARTLAAAALPDTSCSVRSGTGSGATSRLQGLRATSFRFRLPDRRDVRFRVRAIDGDGNRSAWRVGGHHRRAAGAIAAGLPDRTLAGPSSSTRRRVAPAGTPSGRVPAPRSGSRAAASPSWHRPAPVGARRASSSTASAWPSLTSVVARHSQRRLVWATTWSTSGRHTLRVQVLGTHGRPRVDLDAFLVMR